MYRNDYRRALIMMRPVRSKGMSGHVRLERRTLMGNMRFTVTGADPGDTLHAMLMADTGQSWVVYRLGELNMDSRGQSGLTATFDPRSLSGLDLDDYALVVLVRTGEGEPDISMTGMVNGSREVNWAQVHDVACALYAPGQSVTQPTVAALGETVEGIECCCDDDAVATPYQAVDEPAVEVFEPAAEVLEPAVVQADPVEPTDEAVPSAEATAAELLALDDQAVWPDDIASLRVLFLTSTPTTAFALTDYVFVEAPLPAEDGTVGTCAIGLKAESGQPVSVCYALPGQFSLDPPPGLDGYEYAGGWWYTTLEVLEDDPA